MKTDPTPSGSSHTSLRKNPRRRWQKPFASVLLLIGALTAIQAQNTSFPVTVTTIVNPPFSVHLEDYTHPAVNQLSIQVRLNEIGRIAYRTRLRVTIEKLGGSFRLTTRPDFLPSRPLVLDGGIPEILFGVDTSRNTLT